MRIITPARLVIALMLAGFALRLYNLEARSFWYDEVSQAHFTRFSTLAEVMAYTHAVPDVMPLTNIVTWLLRGVGINEWVVRLPFALMGAINIGAIYWLGREIWGFRVGLFAAALLTFLPQMVWFGQDARPYTYLLLFITLQMLFAYRATVRSRAWDWLMFALFTTLSLYTHYLSLATTAVASLFVGVSLFADTIPLLWRARRGLLRDKAVRPALRKIGLAAAAALLVGIAYFPWLPYLQIFLTSSDLGFKTFAAGHAATLQEVLALLAAFDFSGALLWVLGAGIVALGWWASRGEWRGVFLLGLWLALPLGIYYWNLQGGIVNLLPRYFLTLVPAGILVAACGVEGVGLLAGALISRVRRKAGGRLRLYLTARRGTQVVYASVLLLMSVQILPALAAIYGVPKEDTRGLTQHIIRASSADSTVLALGGGNGGLLWGIRHYLWRYNSSISYLNGAKLDDLTLASIEKTVGTVWGAAFDTEPVAGCIKGVAGFEVLSFPKLVLFRRAAKDEAPLVQAREILSACSAQQPELGAALDLIAARTGSVAPGPNLLPPLEADTASISTGKSGWAMTPNVKGGKETGSLLFAPSDGEAEARWVLGGVAPGERYVFSFEYRNPGITGYQRVFITARSPAGRTLDVYPQPPGYLCSSSAEWTRGMIAFSLPPEAHDLLVRLSVTGRGEAEYREVVMWRVK